MRARVWPIAFTIATACAAGTEPPHASLSVQIVRGDAQRAFEQSPVADSIVVAVNDVAGAGRPGVVVTFTATGGGTASPPSAITDTRGVAATSWTLGAATSPQALSAAVDGGSARSAEVHATAVSLSDADVVIASPSSRDTAIRFAFFDPERGSPTVGRTLRAGDSTLLLAPLSAEELPAMVAFAPGRAPAFVPAFRWSASRDTARLAFGATVDVPLAVWIVQPSSTTPDAIRAAVGGAAALWSEFGIRPTVTDTDIHDVSALPATAGFQRLLLPCEALPQIGFAPQRVNVYLVLGIVGYSGYSCDDFVMLSVGRVDGRLLAHELGHEFGLAHTAESTNLMYPSGGGSSIYDGQAFIAHFHDRSVVNRLLHAHPASIVRDCNAIGAGSAPSAVVLPCLPDTYVIPR